MVDVVLLDNLIVFECSFEQMVGGEVDLLQFDFVIMYGVYSWVDVINCQYIVEFLCCYFKLGGIVYFNYNVMFGWGLVFFLQCFLCEFGCDSMQFCECQVVQGCVLVGVLCDQNVVVFVCVVSDGLGLWLEMLGGKYVDYLVYEYFNQGWDVLYFIDVI